MTASPWWQSAIVYQIYPRSFQDSNEDGVGDLGGIIRRLGYLHELGIDAIWISPIHPSPMKDFGYDISDYCGIDPLFGTLPDFEALIAATHAFGMKLLLDLVPNHTSDQHPWFVESRASRTSGKRDWYVWRDPAPDGGPPNNWLSEFGGSAWAYDEATGQYYYHAFLPEQPDLNWRNPAVREAMHEVMRFWFRRGVDGFRIDVIWHMIKDDQFRDNPPNPEVRPGQAPYRRLAPFYTTDRPEVHEVIAGLRRVADEFPDRLLIGEIYLPLERLVAYYGADLSGVHLPFNFTLLDTPWTAADIARRINDYEAALPKGGWPNWVLGNHDRPRIATRVGPAQARVAAMLLLTLRGTPTLYYGDEIGMSQVAIPPDRIRDPFEKNVPGLGLGRDGARTPMQWDASRHAGFSRTAPWLPLAPDAKGRNVEAQRGDPASLLSLYRRLIAARHAHAALRLGSCRSVAAGGNLLVHIRALGEERLLVVLNLGTEATTLRSEALSGTVVVSSFADRDGEPVAERVALRGGEGLLIALSADSWLPAVAGHDLS
jgi:alpha-glucosidase